MKPTLSNLKKLVLKNCNRKNCKMYQLNEKRLISDKRCKHINYKEKILCDILRNKFKEWNSLFFPDRPCDVCIVRSMCIDGEEYMSAKILSCDLFVKYRDNLLSLYKKGNTQVLMPQLNWHIDDIVGFLNRHWFR